MPHAGITTAEHVHTAEVLANNNGGVIPSCRWLVRNGYNKLYVHIKRHPKSFKHLQQERLRDHRNGISQTPEYRTAMYHHWCIFTSDDASRHTYKGMPFYDGWNPQKGGSFAAAAVWIVKRLGSKSEQPPGSSLHIVEHALGFMPGNLEWATPGKQSAAQMFKIIANQASQIKRLKREIEVLKQQRRKKH